MQESAEGVLGRAHGGVLSALFESVKRDGRENMRGVRRRALRGGGENAVVSARTLRRRFRADKLPSFVNLED